MLKSATSGEIRSEFVYFFNSDLSHNKRIPKLCYHLQQRDIYIIILLITLIRICGLVAHIARVQRLSFPNNFK